MGTPSCGSLVPETHPQAELNHTMDLQQEVGGVSMAHKILGVPQCDHRDSWCPPPPPSERTLFVSNHPLGGADGVISQHILGEHYQGHIRFLVNDLLMAVYQFRDIFVPC